MSDERAPSSQQSLRHPLALARALLLQLHVNETPLLIFLEGLPGLLDGLRTRAVSERPAATSCQRNKDSHLLPHRELLCLAIVVVVLCCSLCLAAHGDLACAGAHTRTCARAPPLTLPWDREFLVPLGSFVFTAATATTTATHARARQLGMLSASQRKASS